MKHDEENLQIACVRWFSMQYPQYAPLLHHSPNGGWRNLREAARFKAMGTKAGFPDLFFCYPTGSAYGLFIEFKTAKGRQSEAQKQWEDACTRVWYLYKIVRSFDEFVEVMTEYINSIRQHESLHKRLLEIRRVSAPTEEERRKAEKDLKRMKSK